MQVACNAIQYFHLNETSFLPNQFNFFHQLIITSRAELRGACSYVEPKLDITNLSFALLHTTNDNQRIKKNGLIL
jgi:hypothetical protein